VIGFQITGPLDLRGLAVPVPLHFADCAFTDPLLLDGAHLPSLSIMSSSLPGILANGLTVDRDLDLSASCVDGTHATTASTSKRAAIWLCESSIGGRLLCVDTVMHASGQRAIQADRMHVAGTVRLLHDVEVVGSALLDGHVIHRCTLSATAHQDDVRPVRTRTPGPVPVPSQSPSRGRVYPTKRRRRSRAARSA
jgi:hypothetical protein